MKQTRAITHISLHEANRSKLAVLDALWEVYRDLCQQYISYFCREAEPDAHADFVFGSALSARWQRAAVQQAAGMAQSWRSNRRTAWQEHADRLAYYEQLPVDERAKRRRPTWQEWRMPSLKAVCIQGNANVVLQVNDDYPALKLEQAEQGVYDFWLRVSTLVKGQPMYLPVRLADYHRQALAGLKPNSSVSLNRRSGRWWLTLTVDAPLPTIQDQPRGTSGADVGIVNYLSDSQGQRYGGVEDDFMAQVQRVRAKTSRKAKLRSCLEKRGVARLPSTSSVMAQRLSRCIKQDINRAINCFLADHANDVIGMEALSVASMRFKTRRMNSYLKASQLGHLPKQLQWAAAKRGVPLVIVPAAYSSQECPRCHFADRANRPSQQTFCCQGCGFAGHADVVAARNLESRLFDDALQACRGKEAIKALLDQRHQRWQAQNGCP